ncbi:MAG: 4Fe-4S dicluster domain-containing protein, partial [Deltaproteobacteria bacterium]|nr:4Fe-4S dicluster domain-containing protein [Deltaproteobacteria bacterium]
NGWRDLVTACLYPVREGLEVSTHSDRVLAARRGTLSLLAASVPEAKEIQALAERYGASLDNLVVDVASDNCIVCGLCTRVCETYATAAISTLGRSADKHIGGFAGDVGDVCVGCGACAEICPTGVIKASRDAQADVAWHAYTIWDRTFPTAVASVDGDRCMGCGSCEEACPFHVARVDFQPDGTLLATIPAAHCVGCGVCLGACPTGAITQGGGLDWASLVGRLTGSGEEDASASSVTLEEVSR